MGSKLIGRDINGMRASNWAGINLGPIQSIKVKPNCSNDELLDAIKSIISEAATQLRSNNTDDKYRNIVDMLMMRVRGALMLVTQHIDSSLEQLQQIDQSEFIENTSTNIINAINSKLESNELYILNTELLNNLVNLIIQSIQQSCIQQSTVNTDSTNEQSIETNSNSSDTGNNIESDLSNNEMDSADTGAESNMLLDIIKNQQTIIDNINQISLALDDNFKKLETLITSNNIRTIPQDNKDNKINDIEKTITNTITNVEKTVSYNQSKIDKKSDAAQSIKNAAPPQNNNQTINKVNAPVTPPKESKKGKNIFTNKQFNTFLKIIQSTSNTISNTLAIVDSNIQNKLHTIAQKLDIMYEKQTKGKIDLIGILAIVSLFLLPLIVKKIAELITWLNETYKIDDMIANVLKKVDWGKHISALFSFLWSAIKKLFMAIIEDPFNWLKAQFKGVWNNISSWFKDIWAWVKSKLGYTEEKQKENEKKSEQYAQTVLSTQINNLENKTAETATKIQDKCVDQCNKTTESINNVQVETSAQVNDLNKTTSSAITNVTETVNECDKTTQTSVSQTTQNLEKTVDTAEQNVNDRSDSEIQKANDKVDSQLSELDKKVMAEGPPAVDTAAIKRMESESNGGDVANSKFGEKAEVDGYQTKKVIDQNGQVVSMTASADEIKKAEEANGKIEDTTASFGGADPELNISTVETKNNISGKIIVDAKTQLGQPLSFENAAKAIDAVTKNSAIISDGLTTSFKLLEGIEQKINEYFGEINNVAKAIKNKPVPTQNATVVVNNPESTTNNSAMMDEL